MDREQRRSDRTAELITDFPTLVTRYDENTPFTQTGQLALHRRTIALRRQYATATDALNDRRFIDSLHATLQSWGIGRRASVLVPLDQFAAILREWCPAFEELNSETIDDPHLDRDWTEDRLWRLIAGIDIVENKSKLVALSKTIHHILPDLLPPIDRAYTQQFFFWQPIEFQNQQERVFRSTWRQFVAIASESNPVVFVGSGWRTSRTKVIDNAIIAYVKDLPPKSTSPPSPPRPIPDPARLAEIHSVHDLYDKLDEFKAELESAGLKPNTVDTYVGRSRTFVDWLAGRYQPRGPNTPE